MTGGRVDLWWIPLGALPVPHRRAHVRTAARDVLGGYLDVPPAQVRWSVGRWGKPGFDHLGSPVRFSLSHAGDFGLIAVTEVGDVGVDVECRLPGRGVRALADRYFDPADRELLAAAAPERQHTAYLRLWTRKEACVKAAGGRLADGLALPVGAVDGALVHDPTGRLGGPWTVAHPPAPTGYVAAVALARPGAFTVVPHTYRDAPPGSG